MTGNRCAFPVIDVENRARGCGAPATTTRTTYGVELDACDACAANVDAQGVEPKARREAPPPRTCVAGIRDKKGERLCGTPATVEYPTPTREGHPPVTTPFCAAHAPSAIDAKAARAAWDAKQAKLPPGKRRTWEQACADDEAHLGRALRRAGKRGGP